MRLGPNIVCVKKAGLGSLFFTSNEGKDTPQTECNCKLEIQGIERQTFYVPIFRDLLS